MLSKPLFYVILLGRITVGVILMLAIIELTNDQAIVVSMAADLVGFGIIFTLFWRPPYTYGSFVAAVDSANGPPDDESVEGTG